MISKRLISLVAALLLVLYPPVAIPVQAAPVVACPILVTTTSNAGAGSLRSAIACAQAGDTVTFAAGLAGQTVTLTSEIAITKTMHVNGTGALGVIVDAGSASRIFNIAASTPVTLTGLVLQHGSTAGAGGAVLVGANSPLVLDHVDVLSNTASSGGGVSALALVTLIGGRFENNTGGGLSLEGPVTVTGTEFINNTGRAIEVAVGPSNASRITGARFERNLGGGIYAGGTLSVTGTTFISNTSGGNAAAAFAWLAATVANSLFQNNRCTDNNCVGGALFTYYTLTLTDTDFIANSSMTGGGAAFAGGAVSAGLRLTGIDAKFLTFPGPAVGDVAAAADLTTVSGGRFERNVCTLDFCFGGALYLGSRAWISGTEFLSNTSALGGGGAYSLAEFVMQGGRFEGNQCVTVNCSGGALYAVSTQTLSGTHFISNTATYFGGADFSDDTAYLTNIRFERNQCTLTNCQAGGFYAQAPVIITSTMFLSNTSHEYGGGLKSIEPVWLTQVTFQGNRCLESGCLGGGLFTNAALTVTASTFSANYAAGSGGGLITTGDSALILSNATLSGNTAGISGGGAGLYGSPPATVVNVSVVDNAAPTGGGLVVGVGLTVAVTNTLFANNGAATCAGPIALGSNNLEWPGTACALAGPSAGFITADPLLAPLALNAPGLTWTHALLNNSPARDTGHAATCAGAVVNNQDQRRAPRPVDGDSVAGAVCDIGAYEAAAPLSLLYLPLVRR